MKKKLLTVLLAVVMVFGVFGLTACGGSNKDEDYNYYGVKYSIEDEVKIEAVTFQAVYKMFTTPGKFVLYVNSGESAADFQAVNKLANDWDVTIYHFNPDLTGGYAKGLSNAVNGNICSDLTGIAGESQLKAVQDLLISISKKDLAFWKEADGKILGISGADSTVSATGELQYKGSVAAANTIADGAKSIAAVSIKNPSYGSYTDDAKDVPYIPAAYNTDGVGTMNLFADARLHIYDDRDAITEEKTDVFVTVANYEMFAHLLDNNDGYFAVFFGGTWCPNTQAILYHVNYLAKDYGMNKVYFFDPRLDDGVRLDQAVATTTFDQNAYNKEVAVAESAATIAKLAADKAYSSATLAADSAIAAATGAADKAYNAAKSAAATAYDAAIDAADKAYANAKSVASEAYDAAMSAAIQANDAAYDAAKAEYEASIKAADAEYKAAAGAVEAAQAEVAAAQKAADKAAEAILALKETAALDAAIADAQKVVDEKQAALTAAQNKLTAAEKAAKKAEQYAADVKNDAADAFTAAMKAYDDAKTALTTAKATDTSKQNTLKAAQTTRDNAQKAYDEKVAASADPAVIKAAKDTLDKAIDAYDKANKEAVEAAAAVIEAEIAVEVAKAARKPAYDAKLKAQADYDALVAANLKEVGKKADGAAKDGTLVKAVSDANTALSNANTALTTATNYKSTINGIIDSALADAGLSSVSKDSPEDWAYVVERLVAKYEVDLANAEKAVADQEKVVAEKEAALAKAEAEFAELKANYDAAVATKEAYDSIVDGYDDQVTAIDNEVKALTALKNDVYKDLTADKAEIDAIDAQIKALNDQKTVVTKAKNDLTASQEYKDAVAAVTTAKNAEGYATKESAVTTAKSALTTEKGKLPALKTAVTKVKDQITCANDKVAYQEAKAALEADKAAAEAIVTNGTELVEAAIEAFFKGAGVDVADYANEYEAAIAAEAIYAAAKEAAYAAAAEAEEAAYAAADEAQEAAEAAAKADKAAADKAADADKAAAYAAAKADKVADEAAAEDAKVAAVDAANAAYDAAIVAAIDAKAAAIEAADAALAAVRETAGNVTTYAVAENKQNITGNLNTRNNDATGAAYNYNFTYGSFLANYLPTYWSEWNITAKLTITVGSTTSEFTRMCVPNIMMFNGEKADAKAELIALAEAEYYWADTSVEGNPYRLAWESAVKEVFDANPYATYAPIVVAPEASTDSAAGGAAPSAPAAGAGDSAC